MYFSRSSFRQMARLPPGRMLRLLTILEIARRIFRVDTRSRSLSKLSSHLCKVDSSTSNSRRSISLSFTIFIKCEIQSFVSSYIFLIRSSSPCCASACCPDAPIGSKTKSGKFWQSVDMVVS